MMPSVLAFDIETVPDTAAGRKLYGLERLPDKDVARAMLHRRAQRTGRDSLALHQHRVVAVSAAFYHEGELRLWTLGNEQDSERDIIGRFFQLLDDYSPRLVSWNGTGFDLPVLHYRCLVHGLRAPGYWANSRGDATHGARIAHTDLLEMLSDTRQSAAVPLDEFALMLGLPWQERMSAGCIWEYFLEGKLDVIRRYCRMEVANIYMLYLRSQFMRGALDEAGLKQLEAQAHQQLSGHAEPA